MLTVWDYAVCRKRLLGEKFSARFRHVGMLLLSPASAMRSAEVLLRNGLAAFHPLAAAAALCDEGPICRAGAADDARPGTSQAGGSPQRPGGMPHRCLVPQETSQTAEFVIAPRGNRCGGTAPARRRRSATRGPIALDATTSSCLPRGLVPTAAVWRWWRTRKNYRVVRRFGYSRSHAGISF